MIQRKELKLSLPMEVGNGVRLLGQRANPNRSGADWSKPLVWANSKEHKEVADLLEEHGALEQGG